MATEGEIVILNVDDNEIGRYAITRVLQRAGFMVKEAATGQDALRLAAEQPALILLDVNLPDINGFEVCRQLKANPATASIPVAHLSATHVLSENKVQGLEGGADGYLTSDIRPEELIANINALLRMRRAEAALKKSEANLRAIFHNSVQSFLLIDRQARIQAFNPIANETLQRLHGKELKVGDPAFAFTPEAEREVLTRPFTQALEGKHVRVEQKQDGLDGTDRWFELHYAPVADEEKQIIGVFLSALDITERKQAEDALAQRTEELQRSNAELKQFAYIASHDMQEPLRMVSNFVQLLVKRYQGKLDAEAYEFIGFITEGVQRMQQLIRDLLAYSRAGQLGQDIALTDCGAVVERTLHLLQVAIEESGAQVTYDSLPTVMADAGQLEQVFQNLISNAVKFHGQEPPRVHIAVTQAKGQWIFAVRDNGIGLDPEQAEKVFAVFHRLHTRKEYPGTGIGLAICKKIIERHGGRIWVESMPGQGATFFFTLPMQ